MTNNNLDRERVENMAIDIMKRLRPELEAEPSNRDNVYCCLNALAACISIIFKGIDYHRDAIEFFSNALRQESADDT
jgi:hypothetical protein